MTIAELRQHGSFPGGLVNFLEKLEARVTALEVHKPMLDEAKAAFDAHQQAQAEAEQSSAGEAVAGTEDSANSAQGAQS